jgi:hypothetical protein
MSIRKKSKTKHVQYDDNKLEHVAAGPGYGQPWQSGSAVWVEFQSPEYAGWLDEIQSAILRMRGFRIL